MGPDPNRIFIITGLGNVANLNYQKVIEATDTTTGRVLWRTALAGGPNYFGTWEGAATQGRPYEGHPMAVSSDGSRLFVLHWWTNQLDVLNAATGASLGLVNLPASKDLRNIVASPVSSRAFVTDWSNNVIHVIDTDSLTVVNSFPIKGRCPESTAIDASGEFLAVHVACDQPRLLLMRSTDGSLLTETAAGGDITQIAVMPNRQGLVTARNADLTGYQISESVPSTQASSKVQPLPVPTAPTSVFASASDSSVQVSWKAPLNGAKAKVTGYRVTAIPSGQQCLTTANKSSCVITGLTPGRKYQFAVEGRNAKTWGLKAFSSVVEIPQANPPAPPDKPTPILS